MSKLRCGVVILSTVMSLHTGVVFAAPGDTTTDLVPVYKPGSTTNKDTIDFGDAGSGHVNYKLANEAIHTINDNVKEVIKSVDQVAGDVLNNADAINKINQDFVKVQKQADEASSNAASAAASAAEAQKVVGTIMDVSKTVNQNNTAINQRVDETNGRIDTVSTELGERITSETTAINGRIEGVANNVSAMKSDVASALNNSETALGAASRAETNASTALITAQRTEGALAQERLDREEAVRNGVAESKAYTDTRFKDFDNKINEVKKFAAAGTSAALAASQIPQVSQGSAFSLGLGVGSYSGESALAIGISARLGDYTVTKLAVTSDTSNNIGMGGGIAVEW